jgi:DNA-directed RNA polymerase specialized sigma24 family protein
MIERVGEDLESMVAAAAGGDEAAWQRLWSALAPRLAGLLRNPRLLGRMYLSDDLRRDIEVEVMARLHGDGCRRLRRYLTMRAARPDLRFMPWLIVVAKRVAIDCRRRHPDYVDRRREQRGIGSAAGRWVVARTLPPSSRLGGARPPVTNRAAAAELAVMAAALLPPLQQAALALWIDGATFAAIAARLDLDGAAAAARLVRSAIERLRRHCRVDADAAVAS